MIRVSTGMIRSATMLGGGDVTIVGALRGQRIDLTLTGGGTLNAGAIDAEQFTATLTGSGRMTLGGRAGRARLASNGPATFAATALQVNDLSVVTEGNGDLAVQARYTAAITSNGLGSVTVYGNAACTVRGVPAGPVSCGKLSPPASVP